MAMLQIGSIVLEEKKNHIPFDNPTMISSIYYWK